MADARALLRQERAARQQAKPPRQSVTRTAALESKKRKADNDGVDDRKRTRIEEIASLQEQSSQAGTLDIDEQQPLPIAELHDTTHDISTTDVASDMVLPVAVPSADPVADAELDAFMDEMARDAEKQPTTDLYTGAVLEAAPMTAAEVAAQAREELSAQRARQDEVLEEEKEDAARALEDEFDEMDGLEDRIKRLREQREALRSRVPPVIHAEPSQAAKRDDEESGSEGEEWDDWRFG